MKKTSMGLAMFVAGFGAWAQFTHQPNIAVDNTATIQPDEGRKANTVRAEIGKPLQTAQEAMKAQRFTEALAKIAETDGVPNKTAFEVLTIARMRGAAALSAGQTELALKSFEAVVSSGLLPPAEQAKTLQAMSTVAYRAKDYARAAALARRHAELGGSDAGTRTVLIQSLYLGGAYADAAKELQAVLHEQEKAGRVPDEDQLKLLASCHAKLNDAGGYQAVLEQLVAHHPKNEYWADLLRRLPQRPGFGARLSLDVYRLQLATIGLSGASDFIEMAQLALQEASPAEARRVVDRGFAAGALGTGPDAERHKRLRDLAIKASTEEQRSLANADTEASAAAAAANGTGLFNLGWSLAQQGQADKGLALMELGLKKGGLKRPDEARLHAGLAAWQARQRTKAAALLKAVEGHDGAADIARLWLLIPNDP
jgi:Tfp pilus assembly protein PilF